MKRRIFAYMFAISIITTTVLSGLTFGLFVAQTPDKAREELRDTRITVIHPDGTVVFDSDSDTTENHADRPEIQDAITYGVGEASRHSDTLGETTYYYALRMANGDIVRIASPSSSAYDWLYFVLPLLLVGALASILVSIPATVFLTNRLVNPIAGVDLDRPETLPFDELAPFMKRISAEKAALKQVADELRERNDTITSLTANMQEGLLIMDVDCNILSANSCATRIFGIAEPVGKNLIAVTRNLELISAAKSAAEGKRQDIKMTIGPQVFDVLLSPSGSGGRRGVIAFFMDITERLAAQRQRHEFTANVSHELKTPLTTISGLAELMQSGNVPKEDITAFSGKIYDQSARLCRLIEDIIRLSELDEGALQARFEPVDLYVLAQQAQGRFEDTMSPPPNIVVSGESCVVRGDEVMLGELLDNLLTNAIKYGKPEGEITVGVRREGEFAVMSVRDEGIGIATEHLERVFERFYRVDKSRSKRTGGTGLGLAIVKHVTQLHGGNVGVESVEGQYSEFYCRLPLIKG